ncbi:hypothetical protein ACFV5N_27745 [Streptomyces sp. NPDC059853]|uniref:hypothetical protein n=1 Tax=Streptomyces sp. NPDC059853 TaxID=3346973 RepID=UPI003658873B
MGRSGSRPSRTLRAAVFAALCVLLAAAGHSHAAGTPLPWWLPVAAWPLTGCAAWFLTGRERGVPLVLGATVTAQAALHAGFSLVLAWAGPATGADGPGGPGQPPAHALAVALEHAGHTGHLPAAPGTGPGMATGMAAAHLAAALLSGLWLAYGERAVFRAARAVSAWLVAPLRLLRRPASPPHRPGRVPPARSRRPRRHPALRVRTTRGPPPAPAVG